VVATAGVDCLIRLWDPVNQQQLAAWPGHAAWVHELAWHPTQDCLASSDPDNLHVWDFDSDFTKSPLKTSIATVPGGVRGLSWSPNGASIATVGRNVRVWTRDLSDSHPVYDGRGDEFIEAVAWGPKTGQLTYALIHGSIREWHPEQRVTKILLEHHQPKVQALEWSPDGVNLAVQTDRGRIHILDQFGKKLYSEGDARSERTAGHFAWSPDSSFLATTTDDPSQVQVWRHPTGANFCQLPLPSAATSLTWLDQTNQLATGHADGTIRAWNIEGQNRETRIYNHSTAITVLRDCLTRPLIAMGDAKGQVTILNLKSPDAAVRIHEFALSDSPIISLAWNRTGTYLAATDHQSVQLIDAAKGTELWRDTHGDYLGSLAWSEKNDRLILGGRGGTTILNFSRQPPSNIFRIVATNASDEYLADASQFSLIRVRTSKRQRNLWNAALVILKTSLPFQPLDRSTLPRKRAPNSQSILSNRPRIMCKH
jgi:WD40 repeat protein